MDKLNGEQCIVFNVVTNVMLKPHSTSKLFFLDGLEETNKTFVYNILLGYFCSRGIKCITMATSEIATCLLPEE